LNEIDQIVRLLKLIRRTGMTPDARASIDGHIRNNSPAWQNESEGNQEMASRV